MTDGAQDFDHCGPLYRVVGVAGRPPVGLDDLIGATTVTVEKEGHEYQLIGSGVRVDQSVLFYQKESSSALDTGPVWTIAQHGFGGLAAQPPAPD